MTVLGIRTSTTVVKFAVVDRAVASFTFVNVDTESALKFPAECRKTHEKLHWLRQELLRILRQYPQVARVALKCNEYASGRESGSSRESAYLDAVVMLVAGERNLEFDSKLYISIGTRRKDVKEFAENKVGRTTSGWDEQMADAVAVAHHLANS